MPDQPNDATVDPMPPPTGPPRQPTPATGLLTLFAASGLAIGLVMTILWLASQDERDEALAARDAAQDERELATTASINAAAELATVRGELADAEDEVARLTDELAAGGAAEDSSTGDGTTEDSTTGDAASDDGEADESAREDLEASRARAEELQRRVTELEQRLEDEVEARAAAEVELAEAAAADEPGPADVDAAEFHRWIGELLTSTSGGSRLDQAQSTCFGAAVVDEIGLDALGAGQHNGASGSDNQVVIDAMVAAAAACGIDQSLVF